VDLVTEDLNLMFGDCLERMKEIPDGSVDMVLTDPPYNISKSNRFKTMGRSGLDFGNWDKDFNQKSWLLELHRITTKNATIVIFNTFQNITDTQRILEGEGFIYKDFIVMQKSNPMPRNRNRRYVNACEYAIFLVKKKAKWCFNRLSDNYDTNVIKTSVVSGKEKTKHTTQKPINVIKSLVLRHTNETNTILDFTMGSGTTGVAAVNLNRKFIGIELDSNYYGLSCERITEAVIR